MKAGPLVGFLEDIASNPIDARRRNMRQRGASLWMRVLALGFLSGLAASVAVIVFDWRASRSASL